MALRVMQIYVPAGLGKTPEELLKGREVLGRWHDQDNGQTVLHLLVPAEETEPIMDEFEQQCSTTDGFHVVLFPVEAVLPRPRPQPEPEPENGQDETEATGQSPEPSGERPRISREELYHEVVDSIGVSRVFVGMTLLSAVVAAVGLMRDDVAVVIGAMVIAPLLGPNVAMSLATTLGDTDLLRNAAVTNLTGVASALLLAIVIGAIFVVDPATPAIASRTDVGWGDLLLAFSAGSAGTLAFTRGFSGAVIGVMVAVALMPPLVAAGLLLGNGQFDLASKALLLTGANVICINLAGIGTFLLQGVRPRTWWETERAKAGTRKAMLIWMLLLGSLLLLLWVNPLGLSL